MDLSRSKRSRAGNIDFAPLLPIAAGPQRVIEESRRAMAMSLRVLSIAGVLDPTPRTNCFTRVIRDGANLEEVVRLANNRLDEWRTRDVSTLSSIPETAAQFAGVRYVLVPAAVDQRLAQLSPSPPYFAGFGKAKKWRRVREMAALGYYWGWDDEGDEGWQERGPRSPDLHDVRGPEDVSQYDQLCPRVRWENADAPS